MNYDKLISSLKNLEAIAYGYNISGEVLGMDCSDFEQIMVDAAQAIKELKARAETAEEIADKYQTEIVTKIRERAERAERENKGLQALTRLIMGKEEINFCGYPIGKLQEVLEANPESKTIVFVSERTEGKQ